MWTRGFISRLRVLNTNVTSVYLLLLHRATWRNKISLNEQKIHFFSLNVEKGEVKLQISFKKAGHILILKPFQCPQNVFKCRLIGSSKKFSPGTVLASIAIRPKHKSVKTPNVTLSPYCSKTFSNLNRKIRKFFLLTWCNNDNPHTWYTNRLMYRFNELQHALEKYRRESLKELFFV